MLIENALRLLATHSTVKARGRRYTAKVRETVIEFTESAGEVRDLRCRQGREHRRPRSVTAAVRSALVRARSIPGPAGLPLLLNVSVDHRGPRLEPVACFLVMGFDPLGGAADEWADLDALAMAESVIGGHVPHGVLLDWLVDRGGRLGEVVGRAREVVRQN